MASVEPAPAWVDELVFPADGPPWLSMGLGRIDETAWLVPDDRRAAELALRHRLLDERHAEVFAARPGTEAAGAEVLDLVTAWFTRHAPAIVSGATEAFRSVPDPTSSSPARSAPESADRGVADRGSVDGRVDGTGVVDGGSVDRGAVDREPVATSAPVGSHRPGGVGDLDRGAVHPLEVAGRLVQEDLVLMMPRDGGYHLDAACLCFPSHWRLADKFEGSAAAIHGPVPRYGDELEARVDRYLERLRPGTISARRNWSVHDRPDLFAPERPPPVPVADAATDLWLRSERQTLRRLPVTGAVLFTIRVQQAPFGVLAERPEAAARLAARIRAQPDELTAMNGVAPYRVEILTWLDAAAAVRRSDG